MQLSAGDAIFKIGADLSELSKELAASKVQFKAFGDDVTQIGKDAGTSLDASLGKTSKETAKKFDESAKAISANLKSVSMSAGLFGASVLGAFGTAAKKASDYQSSLNQVRILGVKDMGLVDEAVRRVAKTFGTDLAETAAVAKDAISTFGTEGQGLADSLVFVEQSAKAATAGYVGLTDAAKATTSILKVFNLNTNQTLEVMDALKVATDLGITDMQRFAPEVSKLGVQFQSAGMDFKEMVSALGAMTLVEQDVGRDTMFLTNLLKVLGGGNQEAAKAAKEMGIEFSASALETKKLSGMVAEVTEKTKGNKDALRKLFPDMDAYNGYLTFARVNNGDYQKILDKVNHSLGETDKAYQDVIKHDPTFHLKQMKASFLDMSISIGEKLIPSMQEWIGTIKGATEGLDDLEGSIPGITDFTANMGFKMGEAAIAIAATTYSVNKLVEAYVALKKAMAWIEGLSIAGAFGVGGVAVGGIGVSLYSLYDTFTKYGPEIERNAKDMGGAFKNLFSSADESLGKFEGTTADHLERTEQSMKAFWGVLDESIGHSTWIDAYKRNADEAEKEWGRWADVIEANIGRVKEITITVEPILQEMADLSSKVLGEAEFPGLSIDLSGGSVVDGALSGSDLFPTTMLFEKQFEEMAKQAWEAQKNIAMVNGQFYALKDAGLAAGEGMAVVAGETGKANDEWLLGAGAIGKLENGVGEAENTLTIFGQTMDLATQGVRFNTGANQDNAGSFNALDYSVKGFLQTYGLYEGSLKRGSDQLDKYIGEYERMQAEIDDLTSTLKAHAKQVEEAEYAYNMLARARGEDSEEAKKQFEAWQQSQKALEAEQKALERLSGQTENAQARIADMSEGIRAEAEDLMSATDAADDHARALYGVGNAAETAGNKYDIFGRLVEEAGYKYDMFGRMVGKVTGDLEHFSSRFVGSVTESLSDFEEIYDAAATALGGSENLIWQWKRHILQTLRAARGGMEVEILTLSDYIRKILGITEEKLAAHTEQATRKFELGYEDWLSLAMEYSDDHNRIMNEFWKVYARTQSMSLDQAADVMQDYYREMVDLLEASSDATEESSRDSTKSLNTLSTAVKKLGSDWSSTTKTIMSAAQDAYEAIRKVATAAGTKTRAYAAGGITDHPMVMVGERGPELAALPVGTRILSHEDMMAATSAGVRGFADGGIIPADATKANVLDFVNAYINSQISNVQSMAGENAITHLPKISEGTRTEWIEKLNEAKERYAKFIDHIGTTMGGAVSHEWRASTVENNLMRDMMSLRLTMLAGNTRSSTTVPGTTATLFKNAATSTAATSVGDNRIDAGALQKVYEGIFGPYAGALEWGLGERKEGQINRPGGGYFRWEASEDRALMAGAKPESDHMLWDPLRGYWVSPTEANAAKAVAKLKLWYALKRIQDTPASVVGFANGGLVGGNDWLIQSLNDLRKKMPKGGTYVVSNFPVPSVGVPSDRNPQVGYWEVVSSVIGGDGNGGGTGGGNDLTDLAATELPWMPQEGNELIDLGIQRIWDRMAAATDSGGGGGSGNDPYAGLVMTSGGQMYVKMPLFWGSGAGGYQWEPIEKADQLVFTNHYKLPFPSYAEGGVTGSQVVLVGERGPELAALPMGTRVMSHDAMMQAVAGYANGGVVGSRAVEALAGGLADIPGGGSGGNSTTLTINSPLVQVDRVNASDAADVDKFVKQVSDVFKRQLSSLGLSLNTVGRA